MNQKEAIEAILISENVNFRNKKVIGVKMEINVEIQGLSL